MIWGFPKVEGVFEVVRGYKGVISDKFSEAWGCLLLQYSRI